MFKRTASAIGVSLAMSYALCAFDDTVGEIFLLRVAA
jgi:hypothetical protein